jgi:2',3'-cyclic-nucleotide 2'-phosphodiesterase
VRILFIGDIVGRQGVDVVESVLPRLRRDQSIGFVVANGENADGGSGITPQIFRRLLACGVDCVTLGDHIYKKKEIIETLESHERIVKPANYPPTAPGRPSTVLTSATGVSVAVISLMGRVFMKPADCPFTAIDRELAAIPASTLVRVVDFHAEATSDKQLMGRYLDGRVSAVMGTHTHVPTADTTILPGGTAFQCDLGMTGPHFSILGRDIESVLIATTTFRPVAFPVAKGDVKLCGAIVDVDPRTGRATRIERVSIDEQAAGQYDEDDDR